MPHLIIAGIILELLYLLFLALVPLPALHLYSSPLATDWSWTVGLSHWFFAGAWTSNDVSLNNGWPFILLLGITLMALAGVHLVVVVSALRWMGGADEFYRSKQVLLVGAGMFGLTLLFQPALFSIATLLPFKGVALICHLVNCVLIWTILGRIAPARRLVGTVLYAWNPLVLIELAGNGHNEGVLICLLLLAIWLHMQEKGGWYEAGVLVLFGLAISVNFIALLLAPLYIWFRVRTEREMVRAVWNFCWRVVLVLLIASLIYVPFWHGASTFLAITSSINTQDFMHSLPGTVAAPLRWLYGLIAQGANFPASLMQPGPAANATVQASGAFIFALIYFQLLRKVLPFEPVDAQRSRESGVAGSHFKVRNAPTTIAGTGDSADADPEIKLPGFDVLLSCWGMAMLGFLVLVSPWFWPWYVLWALWIVALRRFDGLTVSILLLSYTALLIYPLLNFDSLPVAEYSPILIFGIPLVYLLAYRKRRTERKRLSYER